MSGCHAPASGEPAYGSTGNELPVAPADICQCIRYDTAAMAALLTDVQLLDKLIAFDSTSSNSNLPIADFICDYLNLPGVEVVRNENDDGTKVNLIIRIAPKRNDQAERRGLILSGHTDVVPANEPQWQSDPFSLTESEDAYIGRGVCDMKGFDALAINTARRALAWPLTRPLVLIFTFDEEIGTLGARHLAKTWSRPFELPRQALIGEPTSLRVVRMHKGYVMMRVRVAGQSAHSGYPDLGVNAIEPAGRVITALADLSRQLRGERTETSQYFPETPFPALNVATVSGGSALNVVPDRCEIGLSARILPGMTSASLIARIRETIDALPHLGDHSFEVLGESPPLLTDETAEIYVKLCQLVSQTLTYGVSFATDAGPFQQMGIQCVLFGPGTIEAAHKPNESLPKHEFARAGTILERAVKHFCCE